MSSDEETIPGKSALEHSRLKVLRIWGLPAPPHYTLLYPKHPLLRTIRALLRGTWGVLVGFRDLGFKG